MTKRDRPYNLHHSFGFDPAEQDRHFVAEISPLPDSAVLVGISEHPLWRETTGSSAGVFRVFLSRLRWEAIADAARVEFNRRLAEQGHAPGEWRAGPNLMRRELGKELVLLAWAIEDAGVDLIPNAVTNWLALEPEERWWLYTMTAAATGNAVEGRGRGWRAAVRYGLAENPTTPHAETERRVRELVACGAPMKDWRS